MYARSVSDPNGFWAEQAKRIDWIKPFHKVENASFAPGNISIKWFERRHPQTSPGTASTAISNKRGDQTAIIWEGDDPLAVEAHHLPPAARRSLQKWPTSCAPATFGRGDRVTIYLPMISGGRLRHAGLPRGSAPSIRWCSPAFRPTAWPQRITDCQSKIIITADEGLRGGQRRLPLKANVDAAIAKKRRRRLGGSWSSAAVLPST